MKKRVNVMIEGVDIDEWRRIRGGLNESSNLSKFVSSGLKEDMKRLKKREGEIEGRKKIDKMIKDVGIDGVLKKLE